MLNKRFFKKAARDALMLFSGPLTILCRFIISFVPAGAKQEVMLIAPADKGSLGDEAMLVSSIRQINQRGLKAVLVSGNGRWSEALVAYGLQFREVRGLGGYGSVTTILRMAYWLVRIRPAAVYLVGADVMDGFYNPDRTRIRLLVLHMANACCKDVRLLGFSFNAEPVAAVTILMR